MSLKELVLVLEVGDIVLDYFYIFMFNPLFPCKNSFKGLVQIANSPWLVWLSGVNAGVQTKRLLVQFPVRACAWIAGQVPG